MAELHSIVYVHVVSFFFNIHVLGPKASSLNFPKVSYTLYFVHCQDKTVLSESHQFKVMILMYFSLLSKTFALSFVARFTITNMYRCLSQYWTPIILPHDPLFFEFLVHLFLNEFRRKNNKLRHKGVWRQDFCEDCSDTFAELLLFENLFLSAQVKDECKNLKLQTFSSHNLVDIVLLLYFTDFFGYKHRNSTQVT